MSKSAISRESVSRGLPIETAVEIAGLSKRFGDTQTLDGLDLRVEAGTVFGLLGRNGAGKTTTLRALLGLIRPDTGRLAVLGLDPLVNGREIRSKVGVVLESDGLYERTSAYHNLDFHGRIWHIPAPERIARIEQSLRAFGLWERRDERVMNWSKGMRQKLAVARALLHRPPLLLLDEPFAGLDPVASVDLREHIKSLARERGVTVILTTHDLGHVEKVCSRVTVIEAGRAIASGAPEDLGKDGAMVEVSVIGQGLRKEHLTEMQLDGLIDSFQWLEPSARLTCTRSSVPRIIPELSRRGVIVEELHTIRNSLEDTFLRLLEHHEADSNE